MTWVRMIGPTTPERDAAAEMKNESPFLLSPLLSKSPGFVTQILNGIRKLLTARM